MKIVFLKITETKNKRKPIIKNEKTTDLFGFVFLILNLSNF
jgi:hypothetical protein